jgi:hypothetical protein
MKVLQSNGIILVKSLGNRTPVGKRDRWPDHARKFVGFGVANDGSENYWVGCYFDLVSGEQFLYAYGSPMDYDTCNAVTIEMNTVFETATGPESIGEVFNSVIRRNCQWKVPA